MKGEPPTGGPRARAGRGPSARDVAARVLVRVDEDDAFAAAALEAELARTVQLDPRDRALATELVYGALRVMPWLLDEAKRFAPRGIESLDALVRAHLVVAAYQLFFTRVPAFAAVSEAVETLRAARGPRMAAFANAVLRKVALVAEASSGPELRERAIVASTPAWLRDALSRALGPEGAGALLASSAEPPAVGLRVELAAERDEWLARLRAAVPAATFEPGRVSPRAILARGAGKPQSLPGWHEGAWTVQEEGSQLAVLAAGARPGETVLDACAGRGNKAGVLARAVLPDGAVDACDSNPSKLERLREDLTRLGLRSARRTRSTGPSAPRTCRPATTASWSTPRAPAWVRCAEDPRLPFDASPPTCPPGCARRWQSRHARPSTSDRAARSSTPCAACCARSART